MTARCIVHDLCSTVLHAIQNWLGSNRNFSSCQQNKIPNHNHNRNHHFSGHQTFPVLPLQNQNFRQILSQKWGWNSLLSRSIKMPFSTRISLRAFLESNSEFFWSAFSYFLGRVHVSFKVILWMISSCTPHSSVFKIKKTYKWKNKTQSTSSKLSYVHCDWMKTAIFFPKCFGIGGILMIFFSGT